MQTFPAMRPKEARTMKALRMPLLNPMATHADLRAHVRATFIGPIVIQASVAAVFSVAVSSAKKPLKSTHAHAGVGNSQSMMIIWNTRCENVMQRCVQCESVENF